MLHRSPEVRPVEEFFDNEYRNFALYTVSNRAIPSLVDGFKPAQRKIAFAANKLWKTGAEKPMKVFQLGGQAAALSFFHHGSLDDTIIGMAQEFKNSLPIFQGIGQFGSLRSPEPGAPRYVGVKFNANFKLLYKDFELTTPQYEEGQEIEPEFFLPIIPTVLLNGGSGVAVGFASSILNRHPQALISACLDVLDHGRVATPLTPWVRGFEGTVEALQGSDKSWVFRGAWEVKNTSTVQITEIPPGFTYEKYEAHLESLIQKQLLVSYEDSSSDRARYVLKFQRQVLAELISKKRLDEILRMREQDTENLTTLDENSKLRIFQRAEDLVLYFVEFRLGYYQKRKDYLLLRMREELERLTERARFVEGVIAKKFSLLGAKKKDLTQSLRDAKFKEIDGGYEYLLSMPLSSLTEDKVTELRAKIQDLNQKQEALSKRDPKDLYREDLVSLQKALPGSPVQSPPPVNGVQNPPPADEESRDVFDIFGSE